MIAALWQPQAHHKHITEHSPLVQLSASGCKLPSGCQAPANWPLLAESMNACRVAGGTSSRSRPATPISSPVTESAQPDKAEAGSVNMRNATAAMALRGRGYACSRARVLTAIAQR
jgi:hypothetical protein